MDNTCLLAATERGGMGQECAWLGGSHKAPCLAYHYHRDGLHTDVQKQRDGYHSRGLEDWSGRPHGCSHVRR